LVSFFFRVGKLEADEDPLTPRLPPTLRYGGQDGGQAPAISGHNGTGKVYEWRLQNRKHYRCKIENVIVAKSKAV